MDIRNRASEFNVSLYSQNVDLSASLKIRLRDAGYQIQTEMDLEKFIDAQRKNPSHVVVLEVNSLTKPLHDCIKILLDISNEIRIILLSEAEQISLLKNYYKYNVDFSFASNGANLPDVLTSAVDLICAGLFRTYQNEQIYQAYIQEKNELEEMKLAWEREKQSPKVRPFQNRIVDYKVASSKEELLDIFYQNTPGQSWIYLKFIPTMKTFVAVSYFQVPEKWVEGFSFKVPAHDSDFNSKIIQGEMPESILSYIKDKINAQQIKFLPLLIKGQIEGILISPQEISAEVSEDFSLMSILYTNLVYESQPKYLDVEDQLTGFYNQLFYKRILEKEIDRAKRILAPLSIVKVGIDKFTEIETTLGANVVDDVIKKIAEVIKQTSRLPDYICRTDVNEFSLVLVNCDKKGAAVRAERLRSTLNEMQFTKSGVSITVSQGISEYPTMVNTQEELDEAAHKALEFISEKGGDRICIAKPPRGHKPDFMVTE